MPKRRDITHGSRNAAVLDDFIQYCREHPELRFWQALRNWTKYNYIYASNTPSGEDMNGRVFNTYYWEGKDE